MHPIAILLKLLKSIGIDTRSAIVSLIVAGFVVAGGGILSISKTALSYTALFLNIKMPLWATTALIVLCCLYTYVKATKIPTKFNQADQASKNPPVIRYFPIGNYKWATTIYENGHFDVDKYPFCIKHDLRFIFSSDAKYCPGTEKERCGNKLGKHDEFKIYETAKSIIENKVRNKNY